MDNGRLALAIFVVSVFLAAMILRACLNSVTAHQQRRAVNKVIQTQRDEQFAEEHKLQV